MNRNAAHFMAGLSLVIAVNTAHGGSITLYVDDDAAPGGNGLSWGTAYKHLMDAIFQAADPNNGISEIHVAQGVYNPDQWSAQPNGSGNLASSFLMQNGIALRGGYAGIGALDPNERDVELYETILSGDLERNDNPQNTNGADNARRVVVANNINNTALLEGFTITAAGSNSSDYPGGGELWISGGHPIIVSCNIADTADRYWTAVGIAGSDAELHDCRITSSRVFSLVVSGIGHPLISGCTFGGNAEYAVTRSDPGGGTFENCTFAGSRSAIYASIHAPADETLFSNCLFTGHTESVGFFVDESPIRFADCQFIANSAACIEMSSYSVVADRCLFHHNYGSPVSLSYGRCRLKNCDFIENYSTDGGAISVIYYGQVKAVNCRFIDNFADERGGAACGTSYYGPYQRSSLSFIGCEFFRNESGESGGAVYGDDVDLTFTNCTMARNASFVGGGIYGEATAKLTIFNSIIKKNLGSDIAGLAPRLIVYSNVPGNQPGMGNINVNPLFVDLEGGNLRLLPDSPCIDATNNNLLPRGVTLDLDGNPRFVDDPATVDTGVGPRPIVDMGAYEYQP